jgi:hypothetical protein
MASDLTAFLTQYRQLLEVADAVAPLDQVQFRGGSRLDYLRGDGMQELVDQVSHAAGRAERACNELGLILIMGQLINPVADWRNSLRPLHPLKPSSVEAHCVQLIGAAEHEAEAARGREAGLAGLLARFVRFPNDVRAAAGIDSSIRVQRSAVALGIATQVIAAVIAGLLVAGILYGIAKLLTAL